MKLPKNNNEYCRYIDILIQQQWDKEVTNASDAHFRAQELTRLQELKEKKS